MPSRRASAALVAVECTDDALGRRQDDRDHERGFEERLPAAEAIRDRAPADLDAEPERERERADDGPGDRSHAAHDEVDQPFEGPADDARPVEHRDLEVRLCREHAGRRDDAGREREARHLVPVGADAARLRGELGFPDRPVGASPATAPEVANRVQREQQHDDADPVETDEWPIRVGGVEEAEARVERLLDRTALEPIEEAFEQQCERGRHETERQRHDRQVEAAQMAAGEREQRAERHPDDERGREAEPRVEAPVLHRPDRAREPAHDEEDVVAERHEAEVADEDVEPDERGADAQRFDPERDPVAVHRLRVAEPEEERHEPDGGEPSPDASRAHIFSTCGRPSRPVGRSASTMTKTAKTTMGCHAAALLVRLPTRPSTKPTA